MNPETISNIIFNYSYLQIYALTFLYFSLLYFGLAPIFLWLCKYLNRINILHRIVAKKATREQVKFEKKYSLLSIFVFGFSSFPVIYAIREDIITLIPDSPLNVLLGVLLLNVWNEIHFYSVHRMMHIPFFMKYVHKIHHKSKVPTVYSVYSFHWFEAFLLSTVPITLVPFIPFSPVAIALYPLASIMINYAGHCNYRFGNGNGPSWKLLGTNHNNHHYRFSDNYSFAVDLLDKLSKYLQKNKK